MFSISPPPLLKRKDCGKKDEKGKRKRGSGMRGKKGRKNKRRNIA